MSVGKLTARARAQEPAEEFLDESGVSDPQSALSPMAAPVSSTVRPVQLNAEPGLAKFRNFEIAQIRKKSPRPPGGTIHHPRDDWGT